MANKKNNGEESNALFEAIQEIERNVPSFSKKSNGLVDIETFCLSPEYLNLPGSNFKLYVSQKTILKTFYIGSRGNENLKLSEEEWAWLYNNAEDEEIDGFLYTKNGQEVIDKILEREKEDNPMPFRELNLVLGRRGTKTILSSIISAYEAYKLLIIGDGNPHDFYNLPEDDEIAIINVALSQKQAGRLFHQVQARMRNSPFFENRIAKSTSSEIRLYTDLDLIKKEKYPRLEIPGSIMILCGHSNPDTLAGYSAILILFDELAFYEEKGKVTGSYFYNRLKPSLAKFKQDGKLVEISSPNTMNGIFYEIHKSSKDPVNGKRILSYQLPTWCTNMEISYQDLEDEAKRNPDMFHIEFGAQWAKGSTYGNYFPSDLVDRCIRFDLEPHSKPVPGFNYYLHIDPAKNGDRYVALLVAKKYYTNPRGKRRIRIYLANVWVWEPDPKYGLLFDEIDKKVIQICGLFHPIIVSYDQYNSVHSLQLLQSHGINCIQTAYNRAFKNKIYRNLKQLMAYQPEPELYYYDEPRLILEMKALKFRPTARGVSLVKDKHGEVKTDDVVDCLAGACATASESVRASLPLPVVANTGWV